MEEGGDACVALGGTAHLISLASPLVEQLLGPGFVVEPHALLTLAGKVFLG